ncbi:MAG TPA: DUF2101 domain-containing protein [Hadesarchaea archaeon]|nr:DUF2101 domain-containing protein [Hadesarchaea archaeon]
MARKSGITDFFRKVGDAVFGIGKLPCKFKRRALKVKKKVQPEKKEEIPKILQSFFERRHAGWPEYVMFMVQLAVLALFVTAVVYMVFLPAETFIFIPLLLGLSAYLAYLAATRLRRAFRRDYPAYRSFVAICVATAWVFVIALRHSPVEFSLRNIHLALIPPLAAVVFVFVTFLTFRFKYGRNFTYGTVEQTKGRRATICVGYDICSNVKAGLYPVESFIRVKRGDIVKLSVEKPMFGLRGAKVGVILEKISR